ncbi:MAG: SH3 domain-containing protein [Anaerolineales bacterium]
MNHLNDESLPNDINDLPSARQRHIRRQPRAASHSEQLLLLDSLILLTSPRDLFFLLSLLSTLAIGLALYFNEPTLLIVSLATTPSLTPIFGVALFASQPKIRNSIKVLVSLAVMLMLTFSSGFLAGLLSKSYQLDQLGIFHFGALYWVDVLVLCAASTLGAFYLLRRGNLPRMISLLLSYEIFIPLAIAGYALSLGVSQLWPNALLISLSHVGLSIVFAFMAFLILGISCKRTLAWLLIILLFILTITSILLSLYVSGQSNPAGYSSTPTAVSILTTASTPTAKKRSSPTETSVLMTLTEIQEPSQTPTLRFTATNRPSQTPSITATTTWGIIESQTGVVIREAPALEALVIDYANNGDEIEIYDEITSQDNIKWYQVKTPSGTMGWLLASLVSFLTPTP